MTDEQGQLVLGIITGIFVVAILCGFAFAFYQAGYADALHYAQQMNHYQ